MNEKSKTAKRTKTTVTLCVKITNYSPIALRCHYDNDEPDTMLP